MVGVAELQYLAASWHICVATCTWFTLRSIAYDAVLPPAPNSDRMRRLFSTDQASPGWPAAGLAVAESGASVVGCAMACQGSMNLSTRLQLQSQQRVHQPQQLQRRGEVRAAGQGADCRLRQHPAQSSTLPLAPSCCLLAPPAKVERREARLNRRKRVRAHAPSCAPLL